MAYENAWITPEEVEKYQLDQDYERSKGYYGLFTNLEITKFDRDYKNTRDWTVNRENYNYLRWGGVGNRMLGIGTPGHGYYIFKWQGCYLFPVIRRVKNKENDALNKIAYSDVFLERLLIPEELKLYESSILEELRDAFNIYGESGMGSSWDFVYNFNF